MSPIKNILPLILCLIMFQCNAQRENDRGTVKEPVEAISPGTPFTLKREKISLNVPDNFAEEDVSGVVGISVYIDNTEKLQGFKIIKLTVELGGEVRVNFVNESGINGPIPKREYPVEVQRYYPIIEKYVNELQFERDERIPLKELNELTFIARLK